MTGPLPVENGLEQGTTRFGEFFDGDPATPRTRAQLVRRETGVYLQIPWSEDPAEEVYRRWFQSDVQFGDDPERTRYRYSVPDVLAFEDQAGVVALAGCRSNGYATGRRWRAGAGTVAVRFAVLGSGQPLSYGKIHGLRSEISGLGDWTRLSSISRRDDRTGPKYAMTYRLERADVVRVPVSPGLSFQASWETDRGLEGETVLRDIIEVETVSEEACAWDDHMKVHAAVRDLVTVAGWLPEHFLSHHASRDDDPEMALSGTILPGRRWNEVATGATGIEKRGKRSPVLHLFRLEDVGVEGVAKWIGLRDKLARAVDPILSTRYLERITAEALVAQVGIGLEALGFCLAEGKLSSKQRRGLPFRHRLEIVADAVNADLPFDRREWIEGMTRAYNATKHVNRKKVEYLELVNAARFSQLVFRLWVGSALGVSSEVLTENGHMDRLGRPLRSGGTP